MRSKNEIKNMIEIFEEVIQKTENVKSEKDKITLLNLKCQLKAFKWVLKID
tara:strand:+ start:1487 stop:1639 length:153 start_codon:yes stop_codon:yes gene_type:complete